MVTLVTIFFLVSFLAMATIHGLALEYFLYWRFWWFDIPMHLLGGAVASFGVFTFADLRLPGMRFLADRRWGVALFVLLVVVVWELFEVGIGIPMDETYYVDTVIDLVMGIIGGTVGWYVARQLQSL